jgi:hypothetical protein
MPKALPPKAALSDPSAGYWNFITGSIILMFIIYITAKGELSTYIQLFFYTPPTPPTSNPTQAQQTGAPVQGQNAAGQPQLYPPQTRPGAIDPNAPNNFWGNLLAAPRIILNHIFTSPAN